MSEIIEEVFCPMMNKVIDFGYCNELQMIADNMVMPLAEEEHLTEDDHKICKACKKRIDPRL